MFTNRQDAGQQLSRLLRDLLEKDSTFTPESTVVVGLPRGGVPVAAEIAIELRCSIDVLVSKKIRAPDNPELAIGAVSSSGVVVLDARIPQLFGNSELYLKAQHDQKELLICQTRQQEMSLVERSGMQSRPTWQGKLVIIVDDGIATGMTTLAALRTVKQHACARVWLATPVIPYDTYLKLKQECDYLLALSIPHDFSAVGCFYNDFHQVEDTEVLAALRYCSVATSRAAGSSKQFFSLW